MRLALFDGMRIQVYKQWTRHKAGRNAHDESVQDTDWELLF
jgi:hypothetical protein